MFGLVLCWSIIPSFVASSYSHPPCMKTKESTLDLEREWKQTESESERMSALSCICISRNSIFLFNPHPNDNKTMRTKPTSCDVVAKAAMEEPFKTIAAFNSISCTLQQNPSPQPLIYTS
ncbi:hypothetical protein ACOSQ3_019095 [Xanthoceras sorbifolium]